MHLLRDVLVPSLVEDGVQCMPTERVETTWVTLVHMSAESNQAPVPHGDSSGLQLRGEGGLATGGAFLLRIPKENLRIKVLIPNAHTEVIALLTATWP